VHLARVFAIKQKRKNAAKNSRKKENLIVSVALNFSEL